MTNILSTSVYCLQIAMPRPIRSLSYNHLEGYIACGGDEGVLKAVKLDAKIGGYFLQLRQSCLFGNNNAVVNVISSISW